MKGRRIEWRAASAPTEKSFTFPCVWYADPDDTEQWRHYIMIVWDGEVITALQEIRRQIGVASGIDPLLMHRGHDFKVVAVAVEGEDVVPPLHYWPAGTLPGHVVTDNERRTTDPSRTTCAACLRELMRQQSTLPGPPAPPSLPAPLKIVVAGGTEEYRQRLASWLFVTIRDMARTIPRLQVPGPVDVWATELVRLARRAANQSGVLESPLIPETIEVEPSGPTDQP